MQTEAVEMCPWCGEENSYPDWDCERQGYVARCRHCGRGFTVQPVIGVPDGMYAIGCRAVGDAFYCADCVKSWEERNGSEFDDQYKNPTGMFVKWWNREIKRK